MAREKTDVQSQIKALISAAGDPLEFEKVGSIEIRLLHADGAARIRILGTDRSMHSRKVAWDE